MALNIGSKILCSMVSLACANPFAAPLTISPAVGVVTVRFASAEIWGHSTSEIWGHSTYLP